MYWGQISLAAGIALGSTYYLSERGFSLVTAILLGICVYTGIRWVIAWLYRIRYWHTRGTRGIYDEQCPNCDAYRYRQGGDWILRCHRCGWKPGWPVVRWFTRSVPLLQLKRTVVGPKLFVAVVSLALIASGATAGLGVGSLNSTFTGVASDNGIKSTPEITTTGPKPTETSHPHQTDTESTNSELNRTKIEYRVHQYINKERRQRSLSILQFDTDLREIARYHSRDMAVSGYFSHTAPGGETMGDRYEKFGYSCRVDTGGNRYATGAENIAYTYAYTTIQGEDGYKSFDGNETKIAKGLVTQWMNSKGHRENILTSYWDDEGIGVYVREVEGKTRVYATQNFC
ncbi:CAP domain-containing protein [Halosimplex sp. TS25]|uniref:CAP domain-containing protein n=1 Tax=Halosimplex rarum TaxID=3396619 RepID=UPI0039E73DD1